jgi:hypothetical protein
MKPTSRARAWAARLTLLVACLGTVATSPPRSPSVTAGHEGAPVSLSTSAPRATRPIKIRVTMEEDAEAIEGHLTVNLTARWTPTDPASPERPWLRAGLFDEDGTWAEATVLEAGATSALPEVNRSLFTCTPTARTCEWDQTLHLELQPDVGQGTAEVAWSAEAWMYADNTDELPKGFKVEVSEP